MFPSFHFYDGRRGGFLLAVSMPSTQKKQVGFVMAL
jgi:hypothetical protein